MLALKLIWMFISVQNYTGCGTLAFSNYSALVFEPLVSQYLIIPLSNTLYRTTWYAGLAPFSVDGVGDRFFVLIQNKVRIHNAFNGELISEFTINDTYANVVKGLNATSFVACGDMCAKFVIRDGEPRNVWSLNVGKISDISIYGDYLFLADSQTWKVEIVNLTSGDIVKNITFTAPVTSVSACGNLLAAYSSGYVYVYDIHNISGPILIRRLGPFNYVDQVKFSPRCTYLLVNGEDSVYLYYASNLSLALKRCWCPNPLKSVSWFNDTVFGDSYVPVFSPEWCNVEMYKIVHKSNLTQTSVSTTSNIDSEAGVPIPFLVPVIAAWRAAMRKTSRS